MSALREKRIVILGTEDPASEYRAILPELPEIRLDPAFPARPRTGEGLVPDLALVCTPPAEHPGEIAPLLRAGVDVLVHGPLATSRTDAALLAEISERLGRTLMTAAPFRVFEAVVRARRLIDQGRIGCLASLEITLSRKLDPSASWRGDPQRSGGGAWMDHGPDGLDLAEAIAGPLESLRMLTALHRQGRAVEDEVWVNAQHAQGAVSRIHVSWNQDLPTPLARCTGERGEILIGQAQSVLHTGEERRVIAPGFDPREICRALLGRFLQERIRREPQEDGGDRILGWIEAGYRSLRGDRWEIA